MQHFPFPAYSEKWQWTNKGWMSENSFISELSEYSNIRWPLYAPRSYHATRLVLHQSFHAKARIASQMVTVVVPTNVAGTIRELPLMMSTKFWIFPPLAHCPLLELVYVLNPHNLLIRPLLHDYTHLWCWHHMWKPPILLQYQNILLPTLSNTRVGIECQNIADIEIYLPRS